MEKTKGTISPPPQKKKKKKKKKKYLMKNTYIFNYVTSFILSLNLVK